MSREKLLQRLFGVFILVLLLVTVGLGSLLWRTQTNLQQGSYDESGLATLQIRLHYEKLLGELAIVEAGLDDSSLDSVITQYDILYGRLQGLSKRPPYDQILDRDV